MIIQSTDMPTACYCLLKLKHCWGEDPTAEINQVRERAYGKEFFETNKANIGLSQ